MKSMIKISLMLIFCLVFCNVFGNEHVEALNDTNNNSSHISSSDDAGVFAEMNFGKSVFTHGEIMIMSIRLRGDFEKFKTNSISFEIYYDESSFELITKDPDKDIRDGYIDFTVKSDSKKALKVLFAEMNKGIELKNGANVLTIKFKVKENALIGERIFRLSKPYAITSVDSNTVLKVNGGKDFLSKVDIVSKDKKAKKEFTDIPQNHWSKQNIDLLVEREVIKGMTDTTFEPNGELTRAQFATFLVKALELDFIKYNNEFSDVKKGDWFDDIIATAVKNKVVKGMGNGNFAPNELLTREEMCAMIINAYEYMTGNDSKVELVKYNNTFKDMKNVSNWAQDTVKSAYILGIIKGITNEEFYPHNKALREQAAAITVKLLEKGNLLN